MKEETLIEVSQVSKCYKVADSAAKKVINAFIPAFKYGVKDFWALDDINLKIKRGESVAIIGRNGSGKSTLLEIITGTRKPTSGQVSVKGRVAALLQLGSGFNPEFSGRENVILNGLLLGLTRKEIEGKFDEIIAFADIGDVIDQPVKSYSSGMLVRLAFSVQVALEPDILIVDEALSVGDFFFKQKCATRMREMREAGTTVLFVSHSMASVREICDRAIVLSHGKLIYEGDSSNAIRYYLSQGKTTDTKVRLITNDSSSGIHLEWLDIVRGEDNMLWQYGAIEQSLVDGGLLGVAIVCDEDVDPIVAMIGERRTFRIYLKAYENHKSTIDLTFKDKFGKLVFGTNSLGLGYEPFVLIQKGIICLDITLDLLLKQGVYSFEVALKLWLEGEDEHEHKLVMKTTKLGPIQIKRNKDLPLPFKGRVGLPIQSNLEILN